MSIIVINNDCLLESINLISACDEQLIYNWNIKISFSVHQILNEHFKKVFCNNMNKKVVYTFDDCFIYKKLDNLSIILTLHFMQFDFLQNMIISICMNKSRWNICVMIVVWKANDVLITMNLTHLNDYLFAIMKELKAKIVISNIIYASTFKKIDVQIVLNLNDLFQLLKSDDLFINWVNAWCMNDVKSDDLIFVAFTSNSSDRLKDFMHTHDCLTLKHLFYNWNVKYIKEMRILQFASYVYCINVEWVNFTC